MAIPSYLKGNLLSRKIFWRRLRRTGFEIRHARYIDSLGFAASLWFKWFGNPQGELNPAVL